MSEKNDVIRIICFTAKKAHTQYTLTIIPHYLLPGCLVRADDVFRMGMDDSIRGDITKMCDALGVLDERTARKHLGRFDVCSNDYNIRLSVILAAAGEALPDVKPSENDAFVISRTWFTTLSNRACRMREKLFGYENFSHADIALMFLFFIHSAYPHATVKRYSHDVLFQFF